MTPLTLAAEYMALTLPSDAETTAEIVGLPVERVARLRAEATAAEVADLRRALDEATRSACEWTCRACGERGPFSPGLDHWWAHWREHEDRERRRNSARERRAHRKSKPTLRSVPVSVGRICRLDDCERPSKTVGMCNMHYTRWRRANPSPEPIRVPPLLDGLCRTTPGDWVPDSETGPEAERLVAACLACPERIACAEYAIEAHEVGIWGATTTDERAAIRRARGTTKREAVPA